MLFFQPWFEIPITIIYTFLGKQTRPPASMEITSDKQQSARPRQNQYNTICTQLNITSIIKNYRCCARFLAKPQDATCKLRSENKKGNTNFLTLNFEKFSIFINNSNDKSNNIHWPFLKFSCIKWLKKGIISRQQKLNRMIITNVIQEK